MWSNSLELFDSRETIKKQIENENNNIEELTFKEKLELLFK